MRSRIRLGGRHTNVLCAGLSLGAALVFDDAANFSRCGVTCRCARRGSGCTNGHGLHTVVENHLRCGDLDHSGFDLSGRSRGFWSRSISHRSRSLRGRSLNSWNFWGRSFWGRSLNSWSFWSRRFSSRSRSRSLSRRSRSFWSRILNSRSRSRSISLRSRSRSRSRSFWSRSISGRSRCITSWRWGIGRFTDFASGRRIGAATIYLVTGIDLIANDHYIGCRSWNGFVNSRSWNGFLNNRSWDGFLNNRSWDGFLNSRSGSVINSRSRSVINSRSRSVINSRSGSVINSRSGSVVNSRSGSVVNSRSGSVVNSRSGSVGSWFVTRLGVGITGSVSGGITGSVSGVSITGRIASVRITNNRCRSIASRSFFHWATIGINDNRPVERCGGSISSVGVNVNVSITGCVSITSYIASVRITSYIACVRITNNRSRSIASRSFFHWATIDINDNRPVERCGGSISISSVGVSVSFNVDVSRSVRNITIRGIDCSSVADHRNIPGRLLGAWATIGLDANNDNGPIHAFDLTVCIYSITLGGRIGIVRTSLVAAWKITYNYVAVDYLYWATVRTKWHIAVHSSHFTISGRWFTVGGRIDGVSGIGSGIFVGLAFDAWRSRSLVCFDKAHRQGEHRVDSANI